MVRPARKGAATPRKQSARRSLWWKMLAGWTLLAVLGAFWVGTKLSSAGKRSAGAGEQPALAQYGGSSSCRDCHREEYALWSGSHHALAERAVRPELDRAAFKSALTLAQGNQIDTFFWTNALPEVTCAGISTNAQHFKLERVIGVEPLRQFLVGFPGGRYQVLDAAYDPHSNDWFNVFGGEERHRGEWGHWTGRGMNWNSRCASCHNTALRPNYDASNDTFRTTMAETSVGCEACHGPLSAHNRWQKQFGKSGAKDPTLPRLSRQQVLHNCGYCHARRTELSPGFTPGDDFFERCQLVTVDQTTRYYADGQVHDEDYEFGSFLGSRMAARGVQCLDCHNPHSMKTLLPGNFLCLRCHAGGNTNAPLINPVTHSHHKVFGFGTNAQPVTVDLNLYNPKAVQETGGECVNCHMPQTAYMQRHWRHDHGFTIPDPLLTKKWGIPNACNRCHRDKDADWALKHCDEWYGAKMERPTRSRARVIASAQKGEPNAKASLLEMLAKEELPYWRAVEAGLLDPWASQPEVIAALRVCLQDTNTLVRTMAAGALGRAVQAGVPEVLQALHERLADPRRSVRIAAATSLGARLEQGSRATAELQEFLKGTADQPAGQFQAGILAFNYNDLPRAVGHLQKAVAWDPYSAPIRQELAVVFSAMGQPQEALAQMQEACRLAPQDPEAHYKLALAYNETGDLKQTAAELSRAVELEPHYAAAWYNLGLAQSALEQPEQAIESLLRAETADPDDARIPYARATVLARLGRIKDAQRAARRALQLHPNYPEAEQLLQGLSQ